MMTLSDPNEIYTAEWFKHYEGIRDELLLVADGIYRQFHPEVAIEYGCGPGVYLERLLHYGTTVQGFEGSIHGINYAAPSVRPFIAQADLRTFHPSGTSKAAKGLNTFFTGVEVFVGYPKSIVLCIEVAEHIEPEYAEHLVESLCYHHAPIVFTAAPPGQGGLGHVNEQPKEYWLDLFGNHAVIEDEDATNQLKRRLANLKKTEYVRTNLMVMT